MRFRFPEDEPRQQTETHQHPPIATESASVCADHMLVTNRLPNTDAR